MEYGFTRKHVRDMISIYSPILLFKNSYINNNDYTHEVPSYNHHGPIYIDDLWEERKYDFMICIMIFKFTVAETKINYWYGQRPFEC